MQHFKKSSIVCAICACVAGSGNAQTAFTPSDGTTLWDGVAADGTKFSYGFDQKKGILFEWYNDHARIMHKFVQSDGCRDPHIITGVRHGHIGGSCNLQGNCNSTAGCTYNQWDYLVVTAGAPARNVDVDPDVISTHVAQ